ncbi:putative lipid II flippase FtsW [Amycolatopsis australiensis]|uniref:Probable peptidoglycan glycosyltransferase FtsW n=1 Tax=Amycolatopsis australiensis TaxID=546364 RepID=A0A1K1RST8_9PSEU|nr:putative lipid II flippase FtsW [Amycolatopsis australiensis]SFW74946.1 cell division-specific peptidoglycan biosynthesis regulator FtsW [Amycolatopsis australiensis]
MVNRAGEGRRARLQTATVAWLSRPLASFHLVLGLCGLLTLLGAVMVLSASAASAYDPHTGSGVYGTFYRHLAYIGAGLCAFWAALRTPLPALRRASPLVMIVALALLVLVITPLGVSMDGAQRWFALGPLSLQPVEVAKVALTLWGAHILVIKSRLLRHWRHLLVPVVPAGLLMFALVMAQPNLSGTITLGIVLIALLWFAGAPKRLFAVLVAGAGVGFLVLALAAQYRLARVLSFVSGGDASGADYQALQAKYALADGGLLGVGLGRGASKWRYLPNVQNDFIFALVGEELGFVGCVVVLVLFGGVASVGMRIAIRNRDPWIRMVAGTITVVVVAQAAINIGYVVNILPVTGVTLPLISYGGTSLVVTMFLFGVLAHCARHEPDAVADLRTLGPGRIGSLLRLPQPRAASMATDRHRQPQIARSGTGPARRPDLRH